MNLEIWIFVNPLGPFRPWIASGEDDKVAYLNGAGLRLDADHNSDLGVVNLGKVNNAALCKLVKDNRGWGRQRAWTGRLARELEQGERARTNWSDVTRPGLYELQSCRFSSVAPDRGADVHVDIMARIRDNLLRLLPCRLR
ncbi:hypothetical protein M434DRAFT_27199 [Hypoxylon sp. CO27-5]|nr:hypothetical protein M434DRAFT_27199 [Hypoxylon sp. CO27-5]